MRESIPSLVANGRAAQVKWKGKHLFWPCNTNNTASCLQEQLILILSPLKRLVGALVRELRARFLQWTKPLTSSLPLQTLADLGKSKSELVTENVL